MQCVAGRFASFLISCAATLLATVACAAEAGISDSKIVLGSFLPLQSGLAAGAAQMKEGTDAYFKYVNDSDGVNGRKIEWIVENNSYNPQQTAAVVKKLVNRDGVFALVSTLGTVTNLAVLPFLAQRDVPIINPAGGHLLLNKPKDKNVFGVLPLSSEIGESMTDFAVTKLGARRVAVFFQNDQFGKDQRDGAAEYLKSKGSQPAGEASYVPSDVDISAQVIALRQAESRRRHSRRHSQARRAVRQGDAAAGMENQSRGPQYGGRSGRLGPCRSGGVGRCLRQPDDRRGQHGQARGEEGKRDPRKVLSTDQAWLLSLSGNGRSSHRGGGDEPRGKGAYASKADT